MSDLVSIKLWLPDREALKKVLSSAQLGLDCGSPKQDENGNFIITVYATPAEADKVIQLNYKSEIDPNYGAELQQRRDEVSKIDRFQGGTIVPKGIGTKR